MSAAPGLEAPVSAATPEVALPPTKPSEILSAAAVEVVAKVLCRQAHGMNAWDVDYRTEEGLFAPLWSTYLHDAEEALTDVRGFSALRQAAEKAREEGA
jgi:hypothetical protein